MGKEGGVYNVKTRNRVYDKTKFKGSQKRFLSGKQGKWHEEEHNILAPDKEIAEKKAKENIRSRRVLGKPRFRQKNMARDIEILNTQEAQLDPKKNYIPLSPMALRDYYATSLFSDLQSAVQLRKTRNEEFDRGELKGLDIEDYVDSVKEEISLWIKCYKRNIFEVGHLLTDIKMLLPHKKFQSWVKENLPFSIRTAQNMMSVYRHCLSTPIVVQYFKPSVLYKICSSNFPEELREEFLSSATGKVDIGMKDLMVIQHKYLNGEIDTDDPEVQNFLGRQKVQEVKQRYIEELKGLKRDTQKRLATIKRLNKTNDYNPLLSEDDDYFEKEYSELESFLESVISRTEGKIVSLEAVV